ncbi:MAG: hypothetical protein RLZZ324_782 [Candidatus Parcubacteria bacterium]|jgi:glutamyl-tRNA synthetase
MVRVRFAPSPTGYLHIGGLRTALYNELFAQRHGGVFVLRIEDTDRTRYVEGAVENLLRTLAWAGVTPAEGPYLADDGSIKERGDHGPYVQSARLDKYQAAAADLLAKGAAYRCFCSPERLEEVKKAQAAAKQPMIYDKLCRALPPADAAARAEKGEPHVLRMRMPDSGATMFTDAIRGDVSFENVLVDDQVLMKTDGYPTYHLANVVDDHDMQITHVIRGEEWLPSTPKHIVLYLALGWTPPTFAHLPLLLNADRSKLSKRQGDVAVEDYKNKGYLPEAMVNFVALLGWNPTADREVYEKRELAEAFDLGKINKAGAVVSMDKLNWLNREYLKAMPMEEIGRRAEPFFVESGILKREGDKVVSAATGAAVGDMIARAAELEKRRVDTLAQLPEATAFLFSGPLTYEQDALVGKKSDAQVAKARLEGLLTFLADLAPEAWATAKTLEEPVIAHIAAQGWTNGESLWPFRVALTARAQSPSPFEVAWALGKDKTLSRIQDALRTLA